MCQFQCARHRSDRANIWNRDTEMEWCTGVGVVFPMGLFQPPGSPGSYWPNDVSPPLPLNLPSIGSLLGFKCYCLAHFVDNACFLLLLANDDDEDVFHVWAFLFSDWSVDEFIGIDCINWQTAQMTICGGEAGMRLDEGRGGGMMVWCIGMKSLIMALDKWIAKSSWF